MLEWRKELETGYEEVDDQHQELFRRFNALLRACHQGKGKEEVGRLLLFLGDYVRAHFTDEEHLQMKHNYPGYPAHKKEHEEFISSLRNLEAGFAAEGADIALVIQTNHMIMKWLNRHIGGTDKEMAKFLQNGVLTPQA